jgi:hypothetical protein
MKISETERFDLYELKSIATLKLRISIRAEITKKSHPNSEKGNLKVEYKKTTPPRIIIAQ